MERTLTSGAILGDRPRPAKNYLNETKGIKSWLSTVDHKRIGIMYLCAVCTAFLMGGIFALLVRLSLLNPQHTLFGKHWVTAEMYNRFFTLHGAIMVFLFIIPAIPASLANFVLPMMLGAKDVAFPRINLMSFYLWCIGADHGHRLHGDRRRRHRLDVLHPLFHHHRWRRRPDDHGGFHPGLLLHLHRTELHRHRP